MGIRQFRRDRNVNQFQDKSDRVYARNDQLSLTSRDIGMHLAKQQAKMNRNALEVDTRMFYYFRRRSSGRMCSCMLGDENTPHSTCQICFNTGFVGGYDKYGTCTEIIDVTHPALVLTNTHAAYEDNTRPVFFKLDKDARIGTIQATISIRKTNHNYIDVLQVYSNASSLEGSGIVDVMCKEHGTNTWLQFNTSTISNILANPSADSIDILVYMKRKSLNAPSPVLSHIYVRYGLLPRARSILHADIPRNTETITMQEYGFEEQFGTITMFMDNTVQTYTIDDFFYYLDKKKFWKITESQPLYTMGMHLNFDITARYMQQFEIQTSTPI